MGTHFTNAHVIAEATDVYAVKLTDQRSSRESVVLTAAPMWRFEDRRDHLPTVTWGNRVQVKVENGERGDRSALWL